MTSFAELTDKTVAVTRGAIEDQELTKVAPPTADIQRFEDNSTTVSAFVSGQVQFVATGASVAGNMMARNPQLSAKYKLLLKDSPNFMGVAKGEDALRGEVNEIILATKKSGEIDTMAKKWLGRPAGNLPEKGQLEAAASLAMSRVQPFLHVVLPPALTKVWPALTSQIIIVMRGSAVCGQISTKELGYAANPIQSRNFRAFEAFIIANAIYMVLLSIGVRALPNWLGPRYLFGGRR